ncbi:MAG: glucose-6-phosphate isomerase family protein [Anaerolineae bacterium]|nr:glucose-6-phosphate isomerase family protein [Anaerolineae bacterium]
MTGAGLEVGKGVLDLTGLSGFPLFLDGDGAPVYGPDVVVEERRARMLDDLAPVALEPASCHGSRAVAYYMDNGVYRRADAVRLAGLALRFEVTLIPARRLGREYVKTLGHVHSVDPQSGMTWPEICEVVVGTAHFLLQTLDPDGPSAGRAWLVEAKAGQKVILPPDLDHLTINPGPGPLLFTDVIALGVTADYERFRAARGAAYLEVEGAEGGTLVPNPAYRSVPPLERLLPREYPDLALSEGEPLYTAFVRTRGEKWAFLTDPRRFWGSFPDLASGYGS